MNFIAPYERWLRQLRAVLDRIEVPDCPRHANPECRCVGPVVVLR